MKPVLLIVDDDDEIRSQLRWSLAEDYEVCLAENRAAALEALRQHRPGVVLLDLGLPPQPATPEEGLATLAEIRALSPHTKVIILSGQSERAVSLRAVADGAYDFLAKPPELDELRIVLKRAFHVARLEKECREMQAQVSTTDFEGMLGTSPQIQVVFSTIKKVAATEAPVLILGESGTGKEMVARAIHRRSERRDGPFVAINCGAIPETLIEAELFGHEKGAFTGAHAQRIGRIETAGGGTLFLDEIGELPLPLQVKLLRYLQEHTIERIGGRKEIRVDARLLTATHVDLRRAIEENRFREDLYYRIAVVSIRLPSLRERAGDIRLLAQSFLRRFGVENKRASLKFSQEALRALGDYPWPGNVRELENRVKRAVIMAEKGPYVRPEDLELGDLPAGGEPSPSTPPKGLKEARETIERQMIEDALRRHGGKISPAAADLGISRPTFYELMDKLGIKREG